MFVQNIDNCLADAIGDGGISASTFNEAKAKAHTALTTLRDWHGSNKLELLNLPQRRGDLAACRAAADLLLSGARDVVLLGTGGSSLGAQTLAQLAGYRVPGIAPISHHGAPVNFHFFDNLDANTIKLALRQLDLKATRFLAVSKSGGTPETVVQLLAVLQALEEDGLIWNAAAHIVLLSEPGSGEKNVFRRFAERYNLTILDHDTAIGGRYAVLSNVGMLPAMLFGLEAQEFRVGAGEILEPLLAGAEVDKMSPAMGAVVNYALSQHCGVTTTVMMPYSDRLRLFSNWFAQLWAESLGKNGHGTQPVAAAGPVDQHSQMQLFLAGPRDKLLNVIMLPSAGRGTVVSEDYRTDPLVGYLAGHSIGDLTDCQQRATIATYAGNGRPVRSFMLDGLNERVMGGLLMHFMLETIITGLMLEIDPFDQPAVEESKILTRQYLETM